MYSKIRLWNNRKSGNLEARRESNRKEKTKSMLLSRTTVLIWTVGLPVAARAFSVKSTLRQFCSVAGRRNILATDMLGVCIRLVLNKNYFATILHAFYGTTAMKSKHFPFRFPLLCFSS